MLISLDAGYLGSTTWPARSGEGALNALPQIKLNISYVGGTRPCKLSFDWHQPVKGNQSLSETCRFPRGFFVISRLGRAVTGGRFEIKKYKARFFHQ